MMKTKTILAAAFAAVSLSVAQADVYQGSSEYSYDAPRDSIITASIGGGYFFDLEEAYAVGAVGLNLGNNDLLGIQLLHMSDQGDFNYFGDIIDLDVDITTIGLVYKGYQEVGSNGGFYYSASAGVAILDVDGKSKLRNISGGDTANEFYIDGSVGFQQFLSENVAFNIGLRLLHLSDAEVEDKGVRLRFEPESIYVGIEAGLTFRF